MPQELRFTDARGAEWSAFEVAASRITFGDDVVEERPAHLRFEPLARHAGPPRQTLHYPADWHALSHDELGALCEEAEPMIEEHTNADASEELRRHLDDLST